VFQQESPPVRRGEDVNRYGLHRNALCFRAYGVCAFRKSPFTPLPRTRRPLLFFVCSAFVWRCSAAITFLRQKQGYIYVAPLNHEALCSDLRHAYQVSGPCSFSTGLLLHPSAGIETRKRQGFNPSSKPSRRKVSGSTLHPWIEFWQALREYRGR